VEEKIEWAKQTIPLLPLKSDEKEHLLVRLEKLRQSPDEHLTDFIDQVELLNNWSKLFEAEVRIGELEQNREANLEEQKLKITEIIKNAKHKTEGSRLAEMRETLKHVS
jgi:hypothetical protein